MNIIIIIINIIIEWSCVSNHLDIEWYFFWCLIVSSRSSMPLLIKRSSIFRWPISRSASPIPSSTLHRRCSRPIWATWTLMPSQCSREFFSVLFDTHLSFSPFCLVLTWVFSQFLYAQVSFYLFCFMLTWVFLHFDLCSCEFFSSSSLQGFACRVLSCSGLPWTLEVMELDIKKM